MSEEHCVISSLIVESLAEDADRVAAALALVDGVEVHGQNPGQVVITIERESLEESHELANTITRMDGVTAVNLIYANFEDDANLQAKFDSLQARSSQAGSPLAGNEAG